MKSLNLSKSKDNHAGTQNREISELEMKLAHLGRIIHEAKHEQKLKKEELINYVGIKIRSFLD